MKTLHAYGGFVLDSVGYVLGVMLILWSVFCWPDAEAVVLTIFFAILLISMVAFGGVKIYRTHSIRYGNGRVVIRRYSKERCVNGRPVGTWKIREDEFLLEEIDVYGWSREILGHDVEFHIPYGGHDCTEILFQLKDGKRIGYEAVYYTPKAENEFFCYIFEETGIEFQK